MQRPTNHSNPRAKKENEMIPNLDQLLIVCGIVTIVVFGVVYVLVGIMKQDDSSSE